MIRLRKLTLGLLTGLLMISIAGCSSDTKVISKESGAETSAVSASEDNNNVEATTEGGAAVEASVRYVFTYKGTEIFADQDANSVVQKIDETPSYFEEPSCAADGMSKYYTYSDFEIITYPDGDNDLIGCISLSTDNVATPEGIDLSKTKSDVITAYGDNYTEVPGGISYTDGTTILTFFFDTDENISSIRYTSTIM